MPNVNQIIIGGIVIVVVVVGIFLFTTGKITPVESPEPEEQTLAAETLSLAGKVTSVDADNNSFVMTDGQSEQEFTIQIGVETEFIRLVFPFDLASPPEDLETFVPERQNTTVQELAEGDFVFVRSSHEVKSGEEVVDPIEIQILP